jgi:hypothetical protein
MLDDGMNAASLLVTSKTAEPTSSHAGFHLRGKRAEVTLSALRGSERSPGLMAPETERRFLLANDAWKPGSKRAPSPAALSPRQECRGRRRPIVRGGLIIGLGKNALPYRCPRGHNGSLGLDHQADLGTCRSRIARGGSGAGGYSCGRSRFTDTGLLPNSCRHPSPEAHTLRRPASSGHHRRAPAPVISGSPACTPWMQPRHTLRALL